MDYGKSISFVYLCILSGLTFVISTLPQYGATFTDLPVVGLIKTLFFLQLKQYSHVYFKYKIARFAIMCLVYRGCIDCIEDIVPHPVTNVFFRILALRLFGTLHLK